jgi:hypothetical protein
MRTLTLVGFLIVFAGCGDTSTTSNPDASSSTDGSTSSDGNSNNDGSGGQDGAPNDSANDLGSGGDSPDETGAGPCNPNDPSTCPNGKKCCSEPTHTNPPSVYECVMPNPDGSCPLYP